MQRVIQKWSGENENHRSHHWGGWRKRIKRNWRERERENILHHRDIRKGVSATEGWMSRSTGRGVNSALMRCETWVLSPAIDVPFNGLRWGERWDEEFDTQRKHKIRKKKRKDWKSVEEFGWKFRELFTIIVEEEKKGVTTTHQHEGELPRGQIRTHFQISDYF